MDIAIVWNPLTASGDWAIGTNDIFTGNDLQTAVLVSLFTDKAATSDFPATGNPPDRRGWWADAYSGDQIGSNLWQLERGIKNDATLDTAIKYARLALQWMLDDGVAATVDVIGDWQGDGGETLALQVTITEPSGGVHRFKYSWAWAAGPVSPPPPGLFPNLDFTSDFSGDFL